MIISEAAFSILVWAAIASSAALMVYILVRFFVELKRNDLW
jgi:hypothetical protein